MSSTRHRLVLSAIAAALILIAAGVGVRHVGSHAGEAVAASAAPPATSVDVAQIISRPIIDWQSYSGRLQAVDQVEIRPQVSGKLIAVNFTDGSLVKQGDVLFTIDPRPFQAEVARAEAQLAAAKARADYTATDLGRGQRLLAENAIAKRDFDEKQNAAREAAAMRQSAQAQLDSARLNLEYTRITAPVSGRVSRAEMTVGNVVAAGPASPPLTTLVSVAKMYASFDVDEQSFLKYVNPARAAGTSVIVDLGLANEEGYPRSGVIASIDNRLSTSSGTIRVRAVFDNANGMLVPGLYARIRLGGGTPRQALLIDEKAVGTDQAKRFVLVVDDKNHTVYREVKLGDSQGGLRVVESGLKAGERVVVNGLQRIRPGDPITPNTVRMADAPALPAVASLQ